MFTVKPKITYIVNQSTSEMQEQVTMTCEASGDPTPTISWSYGEHVFTEGEQVKITKAVWMKVKAKYLNCRYLRAGILQVCFLLELMNHTWCKVDRYYLCPSFIRFINQYTIQKCFYVTSTLWKNYTLKPLGRCYQKRKSIMR